MAWDVSRCWLGILDCELHVTVVLGLPCSPIQFCNTLDWVLRWGRLVPRLSCCWLDSYHLHWSVGHALMATEVFAQNCRLYVVSGALATTSVLRGWGAVSRHDTLTDGLMQDKSAANGWAMIFSPKALILQVLADFLLKGTRGEGLTISSLLHECRQLMVGAP